MKRSDRDRLGDVRAACDAIARHLARSDMDDEIVFDAIRVRLIEIGEAVKDISPATLAAQPDIPWREIAGMRDRLTHHYFDAEHSIVERTARHDIPELLGAVERLLAGE